MSKGLAKPLPCARFVAKATISNPEPNGNVTVKLSSPTTAPRQNKKNETSAFFFARSGCSSRRVMIDQLLVKDAFEIRGGICRPSISPSPADL
jgi:hypothetical protein